MVGIGRENLRDRDRDRERFGRNVVTVGEKHDVEVASEEDEGVEAILHSLRYHMRRRSWSHRLRRHAVHQQAEP